MQWSMERSGSITDREAELLGKSHPITSFGKREETEGIVTLYLLHLLFLFLKGHIIEKKWEYSEISLQLFIDFNKACG